MKRSCTNCGTELPENAGFCPKCGTKLETPCCPACGKEIDLGAAFCIHCGQPLGESREEAQAAALPQTETERLPGSASLEKEKHPALKIIGIILALLVLIFAAICGFEEIYLRKMYPNQIMLNADVVPYAQTEINYHLAPENYEITVEIADGDLAKRTAMPKYENGVFTYLFVDYVYDITVSDGNESISGTVTVDVSFEADPFKKLFSI